jgi:hypothetical protein
MRRRFLSLLLVAALACVQSGCGTLLNLCSPPTAPPPPAIPYEPFRMPDTCFPFGGVARSVSAGATGTIGGMFVGANRAGRGGILLGTGLFAVGAVVLAVDAPLSLIGDVVTWPIAQARMDGTSWATWWSKQSEKEVKPAMEGQGLLLPVADLPEHVEPVWRPAGTPAEPPRTSDASPKIPETPPPVLQMP